MCARMMYIMCVYIIHTSIEIHVYVHTYTVVVHFTIYVYMGERTQS